MAEGDSSLPLTSLPVPLSSAIDLDTVTKWQEGWRTRTFKTKRTLMLAAPFCLTWAAGSPFSVHSEPRSVIHRPVSHQVDVPVNR